VLNRQDAKIKATRAMARSWLALLEPFEVVISFPRSVRPRCDYFIGVTLRLIALSGNPPKEALSLAAATNKSLMIKGYTGNFG